MKRRNEEIPEEKLEPTWYEREPGPAKAWAKEKFLTGMPMIHIIDHIGCEERTFRNWMYQDDWVAEKKKLHEKALAKVVDNMRKPIVEAVAKTIQLIDAGLEAYIEENHAPSVGQMRQLQATAEGLQRMVLAARQIEAELTPEERDSLSPEKVLQKLKEAEPEIVGGVN